MQKSVLSSAVPEQSRVNTGDSFLLSCLCNHITDDHPGLQAALKSQELLPVFILDLDKLEYLTFTPGGPEGGCFQ
jgi:hypothetical protein